VTWAQHMEVSVESRGYPQIIQVIKPFEYWNNHGDDWGSLILRHHDIEKLWKVHPYCINGDLAHAIFDVATHSPATHRVSRSMSSDFPHGFQSGVFQSMIQNDELIFSHKCLVNMFWNLDDQFRWFFLKWWSI
jgi:hypothetical protein